MSLWFQLEITVKQNEAERVALVLTELGAFSISLVDAGDEPLFQADPAHAPLWRETKILALFPEDTSIEAISTEINLHFPCSQIYFKRIEDENWVRKTQENFPPECYGNTLWVIPNWCKREEYADPVITISPGLAFGTGTHPTTALCLEWLAHHPPQQQTVVDYGCGSGILALGALALGAKKVYSTDHDQQAVLATENNAELNPALRDRLIILSELQSNVVYD